MTGHEILRRIITSASRSYGVMITLYAYLNQHHRRLTKIVLYSGILTLALLLVGRSFEILELPGFGLLVFVFMFYGSLLTFIVGLLLLLISCFGRYALICIALLIGLRISLSSITRLGQAPDSRSTLKQSIALEESNTGTFSEAPYNDSLTRQGVNSILSPFLGSANEEGSAPSVAIDETMEASGGSSLHDSYEPQDDSYQPQAKNKSYPSFQAEKKADLARAKSFNSNEYDAMGINPPSPSFDAEETTSNAYGDIADYKDSRHISPPAVYEQLAAAPSVSKPEKSSLNGDLSKKNAKEEIFSGVDLLQRTAGNRSANKEREIGSVSKSKMMLGNIVQAKDRDENVLGREQSSPTPNIEYLDPNGYWENTYTPGSPLLPELIESLQQSISPALPLPSLTQTTGGFITEQPLDAPIDGALGLAAYIDQPSLPEDGHVLLQISIKGTDRAAGTRPPVTLVVAIPDTAAITQQDWTRIEEILMSIESERRVDDRITLVTDSETIPAETFRYGTLSVFFTQVKDSKSTIGRSQSAANTFSRSVDIALSRDPESLNERVVLTIAHPNLNENLIAEQSMESFVQKGGIGSIIALGDSLRMKQRAALGQGSYRVITPSTDVNDTIREELLSYGSVVARALRLNIQLQPGVKLIEIIGARKLNMREIQRDKAIEKSIDKRIAASLGIAEDRGADDPGIQILIPRFLANDSHVILLDLVVPTAGQIADISLKSKDLVLMRNQILHSSAAIASFGDLTTKINNTVSMNAYAQRFAATLRTVRDLVKIRNFTQAQNLLINFQRQLTAKAPPNAEKATTLQILNNYIEAISQNSPIARTSEDGLKAVSSSIEVAESQIRGTHANRRKK